MSDDHRSRCPINLTLEVVGDKWSLLVLRDIVFADRRYFRQLLTNSDEGIASNILADRLKRLVESGVLSKDAGTISRLGFRSAASPSAPPSRRR